ALALILDPMSLARPAGAPSSAAEMTPPPPPPLPGDEPLPPPPVSAAPIVVVDTPPAPPPSSSAVWVGGGAGFSVFEVPDIVSAALELDLAWSWKALMVGLKVGWVVPRSAQFDEGSVNATVIGAGPFLCLG